MIIGAFETEALQFYRNLFYSCNPCFPNSLEIHSIPKLGVDACSSLTKDVT